MTVHFDDKGKYFTDVVSKARVGVIIQTDKNLIKGFIHARHNQRLKDELNSNEQFMAVTDAVILGTGDEVLYTTEFIAVNRDRIIWILPKEDPDKDQETSDG